MVFLCILVAFVALVAFRMTVLHHERKTLELAREEYRTIQIEHPYNSQENCPHRLVSLSQSEVPGIMTMTDKWCKVCGKHLGPAKLRRSIFGDKWE